MCLHSEPELDVWPTAILLSYSHFTVLQPFYCPTAILLSYSHFTVLQPFYCPTAILLSYSHFTVLQPFYCPRVILLSYSHFTVLQPFYCPTAILLSYNHFTVLQPFYCPTAILQSYNYSGRKEGNILFNNALNTFYLRLYGVRHMVKDNSDSERGNLLLPHRLLLPSSKGSFTCIIPQTG